MVALTLLTGAACTPSEPNVVLIVLDTARADFLSAYGYPRPTTPNIDTVAAAGVRFERAYATGNWTVPTHASIFTGLYPSEVPSSWQDFHLPDGVTTIAEVLRDAGYVTRAAVENQWLGVRSGFGQGFDVFYEGWKFVQQHPNEATVIDQPVEWIDELAGGGRPFFLFLNYNRAHLPRVPILPPMRAFMDEALSPYDEKRLARVKGDVFGTLGLVPDELEAIRDMYAGELNLVDRQVGDVIDALDRNGILDGTLVVITSDHGDLVGEDGRLGHTFSMKEGVLRVPLIMRFPPRFRAGSVRSELVSLLDVAPTILDVAGIEVAPPTSGFAAQSLAAGAPVGRSFVAAEDERPLSQLRFFDDDDPTLDRAEYDHPARVIVTDRYKLVWNGSQPIDLYDLQRDPGEQLNLRDAAPEALQDLLALLSEWREGIAVAEPGEPAGPRDPETIEQLEALGYAQ